MRSHLRLLPFALLPLGSTASGQRSAENAVATADDAFGMDIGNEQIGLYSPDQVRGFSPAAAGNIRIEGLAAEIEGAVTDRIFAGDSIHVGITAQRYPFPAPTGIADFTLRSASSKPLLSSIVTAGPVNNRQIEIDGQMPITASLGLAAGASLHRVGGFAGLSGDFLAIGGVLHWRPTSSLDIKPFLAFVDAAHNQTALPLYFPSGPFVPPLVSRRYHPLAWAAGKETTAMMGAVVSFKPSAMLKIESGLFRWVHRKMSGFQDVYAGIAPDGSAERFLIASRDLDSASFSGEVRATLRISDGRLAQSMLFDLRGRETSRAYGKVDLLDLGRTSIFAPIAVATQPLLFGRASNDQVRQLTFGASYEGSWSDRIALAVTVQKAFYEKSTDLAGAGADSRSVQRPLLFSSNLLVRASRNVSLYGGYVRGLEEAAAAPATALNRFSPVPAIITNQRDAGVRLHMGDFTLITGAFDVRKPFIGLDGARLYRLIGDERHRGIEASLTANVTSALRLVAGVLVMDAEVRGDAVNNHLLGTKPPGIPQSLLAVDAEWQAARRLSVRFSLQSQGPVAASTQPYAALGEKQLSAPGRTTFGVNVRERFVLAGSPASLKVEADNIFNTHTWNVGTDGSFSFSPQRRIWIAVAADF